MHQLSFPHRVLKLILSALPVRFRLALYHAIYQLYLKFASDSRKSAVEMPLLGLALKRRSEHKKHNEADALRFLNSRLTGLIDTPFLLDSVFNPVLDNYAWTLMTYISGDEVHDVWDQLNESDLDLLAQQLKEQYEAMHSATISRSRCISDAEVREITDPRVPWIEWDGKGVFESPVAFAKEVWPTTPLETDLASFVRPHIEREDIPIVFCHGDLLPRNLILPGGLNNWRKGVKRVCIIDWETAAWAPIYWEALKATWLDHVQDAPWIGVIRKVFPECADTLDIDWEWRWRSRITMV